MLATSCTAPGRPPLGFSAAATGEGTGSDDPARTCNLWYIRRELGRDGYGIKRLSTYVTRLIEQCDFPAPLPTLRGGALVETVCADSRWLRVAVDSWLDAQLPGPAAADQADAVRAAAMDEMDAAAGNLRLVAATDRDAS